MGGVHGTPSRSRLRPNHPRADDAGTCRTSSAARTLAAATSCLRTFVALLGSSIAHPQFMGVAEPSHCCGSTALIAEHQASTVLPDDTRLAPSTSAPAEPASAGSEVAPRSPPASKFPMCVRTSPLSLSVVPGTTRQHRNDPPLPCSGHARACALLLLAAHSQSEAFESPARHPIPRERCGERAPGHHSGGFRPSSVSDTRRLSVHVAGPIAVCPPVPQRHSFRAAPR